ncbi:RNase H1/viroplasmin domain-containing protein [Spiroplasma ixodetis]|uniref:RNase H1/viroplasmin domain-containing protein n=1 Tax=Spiroplasma ixodetis TaxID=2141 RepID=UPI003306F84F
MFDNWKECEENIKNFSGAEYKSFNNKNDAEKYINIYSESNLKQKENNHENYQGIVYVDGSFDSKNLIFTYGLIFTDFSPQVHVGRSPFIISIVNKHT